MPLVINALGGGHAHIHTHIPTREPKQFQETGRSATRAWFKNLGSTILAFPEHMTRQALIDVLIISASCNMV